MLGKCSPLVTKLASAADEIEENVPEATAGCWKRFRQWFHCFCVVTFDLELGQTIEVIYPGDATLSAQERSDLCYAAFPDSNSSAPSSTYGHSPLRNMNHTGLNPGYDSSDSMHHFRIRRASFNDQNNVSKLEEIVPASLWPDPRFFHGFSFFRRQRDPMLPRGYFQKSIVLVSVLPLVTLFQRVLYEVALAFFTSGETAIETVCFQIDRHWPPPTKVGCPLSLPLFGLHFHYTIPDIRNADGHGFLSKVEHLQLTTNGTTSKCEKLFLIDNDERYNSQPDELTEEFEFVDHCNNNNNNSNTLNNLCERRMIVSSEIKADHQFNDVIWLLLPHLQLIWELVLLGEPLLVLAPTASLSSSLVNALITLINPLRYYGDYRPFFSIHDSDFTELSARQNCCVNNFVLGVTNPFFLKAFAHWPHILKIGHHCFNNNKNNTQQRHNDSASREGPTATTPKATIAAKGNGREAAASFFNGRWEVGRVLRNAKTIKRLSGHAQLDNQAMGGLLSTHRQFLSDDKLLAQKLLKRPGDLASQRHTLERHFMELTQSFINPLERYIASLLPLRRHLCPFQPVPSMRPFSLDQFLTKLQHFGHPGVRGDWQGLYRQFVTRSPNFIGWLQQRRKHIEKQLKEEYLELLCSANLSSEVLCHRNQVEIVDLVLKFRDHLAEVEMKHRGSEQRENWSFSSTPMKQQRVLIRQRAQLQQQLNCLLGLVDDELKNLLMSNNTLRRAVSENAADDPIVP